MKKFLVAFSLLVFAACSNGDTNTTATTPAADNTNPAPPQLTYNIVKIYPHDTSFFTEGLIWLRDTIYESTGMEGESRLVKTDLATGKTLQKINLSPLDFGEGIAILNNKIYQLTWKNHKVYVYDLVTLKKIQELTFPYEGWGMTTDGKKLIISTGSSNLYYVNPENFKIENTVGISNNYGPVAMINELEYVDGIIYANVYETDNIIKIDPNTGKVVGIFDMQNLLLNAGKTVTDTNEAVLNGIAYNPNTKSFYITGKRWPALFEIKLN